MTLADLLRVLLELDQQCLTSRPSPWGRAAELLSILADHAEPSVRDASLLGDWRSVDLSTARQPATRGLDQPTLGLIQEVNRLQEELRLARAADGIRHVDPERPAEWIRVEDALPRPDPAAFKVDVIVATKEGQVRPMDWCRDYWHSTGRPTAGPHWRSCGFRWCDSSVTHWMPLPQHPNASTENAEDSTNATA